jgi:hypothetical protein
MKLPERKKEEWWADHGSKKTTKGEEAKPKTENEAD